ncbi:MAG: L-2-amino-thiazoline-4-carboxylic acid hydrolase [Candidatus Bathyarchaeia archaeon]
MNKKTPHKFQGKMVLTYEQFFQDRYRDTVGLAEVFEHALGRKRAFGIIKKWAEKSGVESVKNQLSKKPIKKFEDFKRFVKEENESPFWTHALTVTYPEETPVKLSAHITECLWAKTFKEMNATKLGYVICCRRDFATARAYNPKIRLKRTKTVMQGDGYCNHTYYWKERKLPHPQSLGWLG